MKSTEAQAMLPQVILKLAKMRRRNFLVKSRHDATTKYDNF